MDCVFGPSTESGQMMLAGMGRRAHPNHVELEREMTTKSISCTVVPSLLPLPSSAQDQQGVDGPTLCQIPSPQRTGRMAKMSLKSEGQPAGMDFVLMTAPSYDRPHAENAETS
jgi:hypothetical protein